MRRFKRFKTKTQLRKEVELLKRENKALDDEGVEKCELNRRLEKALDKACEMLAWTDEEMKDNEEYRSYVGTYKTKDEWKEVIMVESEG